MKRVIETIRGMHSQAVADCHLRLVGEPSPEITRGQLSAAAGRLLNRSIFYDGAAYGDDLVRRYMECDGLVLFSHRENFGNVVAEAMACGKPVFVSEDVDLAPLVVKHNCGLVFRIRNDDDIRAALQAITRMPRAELLGMGRRGRAIAEDEFSFVKFSERLQSLTMSLVVRTESPVVASGVSTSV
jgi:glycosyltransferase involved in cell wall biosynthesis